MTAVTAQQDAAIPPNDKAKGDSEGAENSGLLEKVQENPNCKLEPPEGGEK